MEVGSVSWGLYIPIFVSLCRCLCLLLHLIGFCSSRISLLYYLCRSYNPFDDRCPIACCMREWFDVMHLMSQQHLFYVPLRSNQNVIRKGRKPRKREMMSSLELKQGIRRDLLSCSGYFVDIVIHNQTRSMFRNTSLEDFFDETSDYVYLGMIYSQNFTADCHWLHGCGLWGVANVSVRWYFNQAISFMKTMQNECVNCTSVVD